MLEFVIGLGIVILIIWALIGLVAMMSGDLDMSWGVAILLLPWIIGVIALVGAFAWAIGNVVLHG